MGIKRLNQFLKSKNSEIYRNLSVKKLQGFRIAIDASNWFYITMAVEYKKLITYTDIITEDVNHLKALSGCAVSMFKFITTWLSAGITPIFVFDGEPPKDKLETKLKRSEDKLKVKTEIEAELSQLRELDLLLVDPKRVQNLKKKMGQQIKLSFEDVELFKNLLDAFGIPVLQAAGEAEKLCSSLCIEGKVAAVFSTDTDNLVYGCPLLINAIEGMIRTNEDEYELHVNYTRYIDVLKTLNFNHDQFVDFAIMCGCDYNTNIKGIAEKRSYDLLRKYGNIDNLPGLNISCLNHVRCRELFTYKQSKELIAEESKNSILNISKPKDCLDDMLLMLEIIDHKKKLLDIIAITPNGNDGFVSFTPPIINTGVTLNIIRK